MKTLFFLFFLMVSSVFAGKVETLGAFSLFRIDSTLIMVSEDLDKVMIMEGDSFRIVETTYDVLAGGYPLIVSLRFIASDKNSLMLSRKPVFNNPTFKDYRIDTVETYLRRSQTGDKIFTEEKLIVGKRNLNLEFLLLVIIGLLVVLSYVIRAYYYRDSSSNYVIIIAVIAFFEVLQSATIAVIFLFVMLFLLFLANLLVRRLKRNFDKS